MLFGPRPPHADGAASHRSAPHLTAGWLFTDVSDVDGVVNSGYRQPLVTSNLVLRR